MLKGNADDMPKQTNKQLEKEIKILKKQNPELRKQNEMLTIQREYAKKLNALGSERINRENKKNKIDRHVLTADAVY